MDRSTRPSFGRLRGGGAALVVAFALQAGPVAAQAYLVGPEDRIRLKVFEWRASQDEVFSWEALNDEYTVGAAGELSLPLVGQVQAGGATGAELAAMIGRQLAERMGLGRQPTVAVDIVEYRPFYIAGRVAEPGAYPYRPGLTLLKAISLAGGLATQPTDSQREVIAGLGELDVLILKRDAALARIARIEAELADADSVEVPLELTRRSVEPAVARLIEQETAIYAAGREAFQTQLAALEQLLVDLTSEVPAQEALLDTVEVQAKSLREDLETIGGVLTTMQARGMEREIAKLDGERLRVEAGLLRAKQEVSRAEIAILDLRNRRAQDLAALLRETQGQFDEIERQIETAGRLVENAEITDTFADLPSSRRLRPVYKILRTDAQGQTAEIVAEETTAVLPGDTIKVELRRETAASEM